MDENASDERFRPDRKIKSGLDPVDARVVFVMRVA
jgi:hypothetical protein